MKLAIMQPYMFPYIGYFQLIHAVDTFVLYDDVQFIRRGWINRNRILVRGMERKFSLPLSKAPLETLINQRRLSVEQWPQFRKRLLEWIKHGYGRSPYFDVTFQIIEECLGYESSSLIEFLHNSLAKLCSYLMIDTHLVRSSDYSLPVDIRGEARILSLCQKLGTSCYVNPIGGFAMYDSESFKKCGLNLKFIESHEITYEQYDAEFIPRLSIIDVLMCNAPEKVSKHLASYRLVCPENEHIENNPLME